MSTEVKARPNLPPALETFVREAMGRASVAWKVGDEGERIFDTDEALATADTLIEQIERAWDAREQPLFAHLRSISFNLGQLERGFDITISIESAKRAVAQLLDLLEQHR